MLVPNATDVTSPALKNTGAPQPIHEQLLPRANTKQTAVYFSSMHALLHAGVGLVVALDEMGRSAPNAALRQASSEMKARVNEGRKWSEAMRAYPALFSEMQVALIAGGEASGNLVEICGSLSEFAEKEYHVRQLIKRETWYPKLLLFFSTVIVPLPITIVVGSFRYTLGFTEQVTIILVPWALWVIANLVWPVTARGGPRLKIDRWKLQLPIVGKTARGFAVAKACRLIGMLYAAGVSLPRAVRMAADGCGNAAFGDSLRRVAPRLERGESLTPVLTSTGEFTGAALGLVQSGEESGDLDKSLPKAAVFLEMDAETTLYQSNKTLTTVIFLLVAFKIGVQIVQAWMGIYGV